MKKGGVRLIHVRRMWVGVSLLALIAVLSGCAGSAGGAKQAADSRPEETAAPVGSTVQKTEPQQPAPAQSDSGSEQQAGTGQCSPMTEDNALGYVAALSRTQPETRVGMAIGQAARAFQREADYKAALWPDMESNLWAGAQWQNLRVTERNPGQVLIEFIYQEAPESSSGEIAEFTLTCDATNNWRWSSVGTGNYLFSGVPQPMEGQDGTLTADVALKLANSAEFGGEPLNLTGKELERARLVALARAGGAEIPARKIDNSWRLKLEPQGADRVQGTWLNGAGAATAEKILFVKDGGLWKVADHTEGGKWAPDKPSGYTGPPSLQADTHLLGLKLGMSSAEVTKRAGQPDQVKGSKAFYGTRDITLEYDAVGKLFRITAESGATARGATIGDSEQMVQALYGAPAQQSGNWLIYSDGTRNLKFQMVNVQGTNYVKAFVLERRQ
jgi:hypothetical protein